MFELAWNQPGANSKRIPFLEDIRFFELLGFLSFTQTCILDLLWWSPLLKGISWQDAWPDAFIWTGSSAGTLGPPPPWHARGAGQLHSTDLFYPGSSTLTYHEPRRSWPHALSHSQRKLDFLGVCFLLCTGICFCMSMSMFQGTSLLIYSPLIAKHLYAIARRNTCTDEHKQALTAAKAKNQSVPR